MQTCQYSVNLLGEKISTKSSVPIVAQTKQKNPLFNTKVRNNKLYMQCTFWWAFSWLYSPNVLCFSISVTFTVQASLNVSLRETLSQWLMNFESRTKREFIITEQTTRTFDSPRWIFLGRSEPEGVRCGKYGYLPLNSNASLSLVLFMPVRFCIEYWNLPLSSVSPGWVIHLGLLLSPK